MTQVLCAMNKEKFYKVSDSRLGGGRGCSALKFWSTYRPYAHSKDGTHLQIIQTASPSCSTLARTMVSLKSNVQRVFRSRKQSKRTRP